MPELPIKIGVMKSRLVVGEENLDVVFQQKPPQGSFTFGLPSAAGEPGSKLAEHDERQDNELGFFDQLLVSASRLNRSP